MRVNNYAVMQKTLRPPVRRQHPPLAIRPQGAGHPNLNCYSPRSGPPAKNAVKDGDPDLGDNAYAAGEALFDRGDPARLVQQTQQPVLKPVMPYEKTGQYAAGTTFAEGLVYFHERWFLYYGCADSVVAVVMAGGK